MIVDLVLILLLLAFVANGWRAGFVKTLGHFVGAVLGFWVAQSWYSIVGSWISHILPIRSGIASFIAFVILFMLVERIVGILTGLADSVLKIITRLPFLNSIQRLIGAGLGFLEGLVFIGSTAYVINQTRLDPTLLSWIHQSTIAQTCLGMFSRLLAVIL